MKKKTTVGGIPTPEFKCYYITKAINSAEHQHRDRMQMNEI